MGEWNNLGELDALDDYSLMGILDKLEYEDLFNLAMLSPHVQQLFADYYVAKYNWNTSEVFLKVTHKDALLYIKGLYFYNGRNYTQTMFILRNFGHIFTHIKIRLDSIKLVEPVQFLINKYCSNATQEIEISGEYNDNTQILFELATNVTIMMHASKNFRLDTAFPQMRKLKFDCELDLSHHHPHLTEIVFKHYKYTWDLSEFVRLNPQLQTVQSLLFNNSMFLASLSELPNLENLNLGLVRHQYYLWNDDFPVARFKSVKNFALNMHIREKQVIESDAYVRILATIQFDRLESFSLTSNNVNPNDFLIGMIGENTALQKLTIDADLTFDQLCVMITSLADLKDLTITWRKQSTHGTWNRFLEHIVTSNHSLDKFSIYIPWHFEIDTSDLVDLIPFGWNLTEIVDIQNDALFCLQRLK